MCLLTNERYETYQTGFSFGRLDQDPGVGLWVDQIRCVSNLHEWHMQRHHFLGPHPLGPWGGAKRSNIIKSELQSQFQRFLNQTLCICTKDK